MAERILIELSGGTDSAVAAAILKAKGYDLIGVSFWVSPLGDLFDRARRVASHLEIPHKVFDLTKEFESLVVKDFCESYVAGRTPNPCVHCNRDIKFGVLLRLKSKFGAVKVATGHYARLRYDSTQRRFMIFRGRDRSRDQSYFLYALSQSQLSQIIFPLGELRYGEVQRIAREFGFSPNEVSPSKDFCLARDGYRDLLKSRMPEAFQPGPIKDDEGRGLGYHQGIVNYTIGQRRGLGIALGSPHYVIRLEPETRTVVVGERLKVYGDELTIKDFNLSARSSLAEKIRVLAQIRYQMAPQPAWLESLDNFRFRLRFFEPQWAITPGQAAVCYLNDLVLGGGMIEEWVH